MFDLLLFLDAKIPLTEKRRIIFADGGREWLHSSENWLMWNLSCVLQLLNTKVKKHAKCKVYAVLHIWVKPDFNKKKFPILYRRNCLDINNYRMDNIKENIRFIKWNILLFFGHTVFEFSSHKIKIHLFKSLSGSCRPVPLVFSVLVPKCIRRQLVEENDSVVKQINGSELTKGDL